MSDETDSKFERHLEALREELISIIPKLNLLPKPVLIDKGITLQDLLARAQSEDPQPSLRQEYKITQSILRDMEADGINLETEKDKIVRAALQKTKADRVARKEALDALIKKNDAKAERARKAKPKAKNKRLHPWLTFSPMETNRRKH